ncbi:MAG: hypothetical protein U9Q90_09510 [Campylobacterota bacterium]|nr:hypothetical protein [Campylobacterota bacterium]
MKKLILMLGIVTPLLFAAQPEKVENPEQKALQSTMLTLSKGLMHIQQGILTNSKEDILTGVRMLKRTEEGFLTSHGEAMQKYMPENPKYAISMAKQSEINIERYTREMRSDILSNKDYDRVVRGYTNIMKECVKCHQKLRRWEWR